MFACLPILVAVSIPAIDDPIFSGPQVGESLPSFVMIDALRDETDRKVDLVKQADGKPALIVFVHERTRPAFGMANVLMRLAEDYGSEKIVGGLVYLTDDPTMTLNWMRSQVRRHLAKKATVGISPDGKEGPEAYGLNRNVAVTVLVAKDSKVTANFALVQPSLEADAPRIFKAVADALGEKAVAKVADFMPKPPGRMVRTKRPAATDDAPAERDPRLRPLLSPMIQKDATAEEVDAAAKKIEAYAAAHPVSRGQIGDIARKIIKAKKLGNYGTKKCQEYLTKWAKEYKAGPSKAKAKKPQSQKD